MLRLDIIKRLNFFQGLTDEAIEPVRARGEVVGRLSAGERVFGVADEATSVFFATDLSARPASTPILVRVEYPAVPPSGPVRLPRIVENELFGETELVADGLSPSSLKRARRRETQATMLTAGHVVSVPMDALYAAMERSPLLRQRLTRHGMQRLRSALLSHANRQKLSVDTRLAEYLLEIFADLGTFLGNFGELHHKISQQEIASELGISRRTLNEYLTAWASSGLIRTTPLQILDLRRLRQLERIGQDPPAILIESAVRDIDALLDDGEFAGGLNLSLEMLRHFPASPILAHRAALSAVRSSRPDTASSILADRFLSEDDVDSLLRRIVFGMVKPMAPTPKGPIDDEALRDAIESEDASDRSSDAPTEGDLRRVARHLAGELVALRARLLKEEALRLNQSPAAEEAGRLYLKAHDCYGSSDHFAAVNAAAMFALAGKVGESRRCARVALDAAGKYADYWSIASSVEARMLLGEDDVAIALSKGPEVADAAPASRAVTRRQIRSMPSVFASSSSLVLQNLRVPTPFAFTGTMLLRGQFDADVEDLEADIAQKVASELARGQLGAGFGALAQGADLLIAEAMLAHGMQLNVILPFEIDAFVELSVELPGAAKGWRPRFEDVMRSCHSVVIAQPTIPAMRDLDSAFRHGFHVAGAMAIERASALETEAVLLSVVPKGGAGTPAGSIGNTEEWKDKVGGVIEIVLPSGKKFPSGKQRLGVGFGFVVFHFAKSKSVDAARHAEEALVHLKMVPLGVVSRPNRTGIAGVAVVFATEGEAVRLATALHSDRTGAWQTVCDYGPVFDRTESLSKDALASLAGAGGVPDIYGDHVLATTPFARERQFSSGRAGAAIPVGTLHSAGVTDGARKYRPLVGIFSLVDI